MKLLGTLLNLLIIGIASIALGLFASSREGSLLSQSETLADTRDITPPAILSNIDDPEAYNALFFEGAQTQAINSDSIYLGCTLNPLHPIFEAAKDGDRERLLGILRTDIKSINYCDGARKTAIFYTSENGDMGNTLLLESYGADINHQDSLGNTPLMYAIAKDNISITIGLLELDALINIPNNNLDITTHQALLYSSNNILMELLRREAPITTSNTRGETPLHIAAKRGNVDGISFLIQVDAIIDARDQLGRTPLMYASASDNLDSMNLLIGLGADITAESDTCETPLSIAKGASSSNTIYMLQSIGAPDRRVLVTREGVAQCVTLDSVLEVPQVQPQPQISIPPIAQALDETLENTPVQDSPPVPETVLL